MSLAGIQKNLILKALFLDPPTGEIIQKPVVYRSVDPQTLIGILKDAGQDEGTAGFIAALDGNIAAGLLAEVTGQLSALIGRPTTPLKKGLIDALFC